jgi:hypothetical protein
MDICRGVNKEFAIMSIKSLLELESDPAVPTIQICIAPLQLNFKVATFLQKRTWLVQERLKTISRAK